MKKPRSNIVLAVLVTLLGLISSSAIQARVIQIGVLSFAPKQQTLNQWEAFGAYLNNSLPADVEVQIVPYTHQKLNQAIYSHQIDFVVTNPAHYVSLEHVGTVSQALLSLVRNYNGEPIASFGGVILVRSESSLNSLSDLKGKRIASVNNNSLGGFQAQIYELMRSGIPLSDVDMVWTEMPHDNTVVALLNDEVDVAFVRTGVLERLIDKGKVKLSNIRVINEQQLPDFPFMLSTKLYPEWAFASLSHVKPSLINLIVGELLLLSPHTSSISQKNSIHGFDFSANYNSVRNILKEMGVSPFEELPDYYSTRYWEKHRQKLIVAVVIVLLGLAFFIWIALLNRRLSKQKLATDKLSARLTEILGATQVGIWEWNIKTGETLFNERWANIVGYTLEELQPVSIDTWVRRLILMI